MEQFFLKRKTLSNLHAMFLKIVEEITVKLSDFNLFYSKENIFYFAHKYGYKLSYTINKNINSQS